MNIPANLFLHPILGGISVLLVIISYALKGGGRKYQTYHYWAGWSAWALMTIAISYAFFAVTDIDSTVEDFLFSIATLSWHFYWGLLLWAAMSVQTFWGEAMRRRPKLILRFRLYHKYLSQILLGAVLILAVLGTPITFYLLQGSTLLQGIWVALVMVVWGWVIWLLTNVERTALPSARSRQVRVVERDTEYKVRVFPEQLFIGVDKNESILRASLKNGIPHTHVCGGNARCSTCRIMVLAGVENLKPRNQAEQRLADKLDFPERVRLACQTQVTGEITFRRLVLDEIDADIVNQLRDDARPTAIGHEEEAAVLFSDIRGFTRFSEEQLPYDVIHTLNRYFHTMGKVIVDHGGEVLNYMGDGMMAIFPKQKGDNPSWRAVQAAQKMMSEIIYIQTYIKEHFDFYVDIGVGIHFGQVVVGYVGAEEQQQYTAVGDTVNFASRVEEANRDAGTRFLVSQDVYERVQERVQLGRTHRFIPKGKMGEHILYEITGIT